MTSQLSEFHPDESKLNPSSSSYPETLQVHSYLINKGLTTAKRMKDAQVAQAFLDRDHHAIKEYLKEDLLKTFSAEDVKEFQLVYVNLVPKIIKKISLLYKNPASREISGKGKETERLEYALTKAGYHTFMREVHKGTKLHNTVIIGALPDGLGGIRPVILRPDLVEVVENPDNYLEIKALKYPMMRRVQGKEIIVWDYWSHSEHIWFDDNDAQIKTDGAPIDSNDHPGFLPFMPARLEQKNDFFGDGMGDLVDANRTINFLMTSALIENIIMSAFGQLIAINLGLPNLKLGPRRPIMVDDVDESLARPGLENVSLTPHTDEIRATIDWLYKTQGMLQGLPASAFSDTEQILSGYAKMIDNLELLDERESDALVFETIELRYLEIFCKMWNLHAKGEEALPEKLAGLMVNFAPVKFPETTQEKTEKWRARIEMGRANQIDWIMEDNPGMSREEAKQKYIEIQKESRELAMDIRGGAPNFQDIPEG